MTLLNGQRLPVNVEKGSRGGPGFKTTVIILASGEEQRNQDWAKARAKYNISYGARDYSTGEKDAVLNLFMMARGKLRSFRFKDWTDFQQSGIGIIGTGNGTQTAFQLTKIYGTTNPYTRTITKPVNNSAFRVYLGTTAQSTGFSVNYDTGVVTFNTAPGNGVAVGWSGEFDVHVRFDSDDLDIVARAAAVGAFPQLNVIELKS